MSHLGHVEAQHDELLRLTDELIDKLRHGETVDREAYLAKYPEYAQQLNDMMATIQLLTSLRSDHERADGQREEEAEVGYPHPALGSLGDFRLLRELGRGGMGVVYEAEQISLNRRVALKVLPFAAMLDSRQLIRFKNKAQAAAALSHPHIVSIYGVGRERGVHYYAMQLVDGQTLASLIGELTQLKNGSDFELPQTVSRNGQSLGDGEDLVCRSPIEDAEAHSFETSRESAKDKQSESDTCRRTTAQSKDTERVMAAAIATERDDLNQVAFFRRVAALGIQAAEALQHAHEHGVVHRDIKPANLMLDETGELLITDFGLARLEWGAEVTMSGEVVGTIRYMSPEQARVLPGVVDQRSDIYSLGITLYELLTQEPAFAEERRSELLAQIAHHEPRRPRAINPAIPQELETVILKAARKSPAERYLSAQEFAEDLQRFLDNKPIRATPPTILDQVTKWCQRNRTLVAAAAIVLIIIVIGLAISNFRVAHQRDLADQAAIREARQATAATLERQRAEKHYRLALQAINDMLHRVGGDRLKNVPGMQQVRLDVTTRALALLKELDDGAEQDPSILGAIGRAYTQMGHLQHQLGQHVQADESTQRALTIFGQVIDGSPSPTNCQLWLAKSYYCRGNVLRAVGHHEEAIRCYEQAEAAAKHLLEDAGQRNNALCQIADSMEGRAFALAEQGAGEAAELLYLQALDVAEKLVSEKADAEYVKTLAHIQYNLGGYYLKRNDWEAAEPHTARAIDTYSLLSQETPADAEVREQQALCYSHLGVLYFRTTRLDEARQAIEEQIKLLGSLAKDFPSVPDYRHEAAVGHGNLAAMLRAAGDGERALEESTRAIEVLRALVADFPDVHVYRENLADFEFNFGNLHLTRGEPEVAAEWYLAAVGEYQQLLSTSPERPDLRDSLALTLVRLAMAYDKANRWAASETTYRQAIGEYEKLATALPENTRYGLVIADIYWRIGNRQLEHDAHDEAAQTLARAIEVLETLCRDTPADAQALQKLAERHSTLAILLQTTLKATDQSAKSLDAHRKAIAVASRLVSEYPSAEQHRVLLAKIQCNHAMALAECGRESEAVEAFQDALDIAPHPGIHNNFAWFLATRANTDVRDVKKAVAYARLAVEADSENADWWNTLALAQYRADKPEDAKVSLEKAVELGDEESAAHAVVAALIAASLNDGAECRAALNKANECAESNPDQRNPTIERLITEAQSLLTNNTSTSKTSDNLQ